MMNAMRAVRLRASTTLTLALAALMLTTGLASLSLGAAPAGATSEGSPERLPEVGDRRAVVWRAVGNVLATAELHDV